MNLVKSRDAMLNDYLNGEKPYGVLEDYRRNRNSEEWRASKAAEELCEYILYLEWSLESKQYKGSE